MGIRRPPAIVIAAVVTSAILVAGLFVVAPGSTTQRALPPLSAVEQPTERAFADHVATPVVSAADVPPAARGSAARFLDHRIVDPAATDRNGNLVRRDLTDAELQRVALEYDIIDDDLRGQPDGVALSNVEIARLHALNPRLKVLRHLSLMDNYDPPFNGIEPGDGEHGSWFLLDGDGNNVRLAPDPYGNGRTRYAVDPADVNVRIDMAAQVRQYGRLGYDGVVIYGVFPYVPAPAPLMTRPLNRVTGRPYTDGEWRDAVAGLLRKVREVAGPGAYVAIAGGGAADYAGGSADAYLETADAVVVRSFAAPTTWEADVSSVESLAARGKGVIAVGADQPGGQFAYASFLLAMPPEGAWYGGSGLEGPPPAAYPPQPPYGQLDLGRPLGERRAAGGAWLRVFERGLVVVNPGASALDVPLPGPYRATDGTLADRITVAARDAAILQSAR